MPIVKDAEQIGTLTLEDGRVIPRYNVKTETTGGVNDLIFSFGDSATHAGSFVFQNAVEGNLSHTWSWPVAQVLQILKLSDSAKVMLHFSNEGAMMISVDSGLGKYQYIIPAQAQ